MCGRPEISRPSLFASGIYALSRYDSTSATRKSHYAYVSRRKDWTASPQTIAFLYTFIRGTLPALRPSIAVARSSPRPSSLISEIGYRYVLNENTRALEYGSRWRSCRSQRRYVYSMVSDLKSRQGNYVLDTASAHYWYQLLLPVPPHQHRGGSRMVQKAYHVSLSTTISSN